MEEIEIRHMNLNNLNMQITTLDIQMNTAATEMQRKFPHAVVYDKMSHPAFINHAPFIAMRILLGGIVTPCPRGENEVYSVTLDDSEYIIYERDYENIKKLIDYFLVSWLHRKGYQTKGDLPLLFRSTPDLILHGMEFMRYVLTDVEKIVNENKIKIFWSLPDEYACGYYRSRLPMAYSNENVLIHSHLTRMMNYSELSYYDVFVFHRAPNESVIEFYQKMKAQNKVIVLDCDDDLGNIPDWNFAKKHIGDAALKRRISAIEMSDVCTVTTKTLADQLSMKEVNICPNLLDMNFYIQPDQSKKPRVLQQEFIGYKAGYNTSGKIRIYNPKNGNELKNAEELSRKYDPIVICWFGSPTHDKDLEILIDVVKRLIIKYQMAINFVFFGYYPPEFIDIHVQEGNSNPTVEVKDLYSSSIALKSGVAHTDFPKALKEINPDIGLCPLDNHQFNTSKSNIKVLEFGAIGVPCICSDFGPYQFIRHGLDGFKASSEKEWYDYIEKLILDPGLRLKMGQVIKQRVIDEYSWQTDGPNRKMWDKHFDRLIELGRISREKNKELINGQETI